MAFDSMKKQNPEPQGTPKTLDEAIAHILCFRSKPGVTIQDNAYYILKDFIAQKTGTAIMRAAASHEPDLEKAILDLHMMLVRR